MTGEGERFARLGSGPLAEHRVVAFDLRGHGRSDWSPPWSTAAHVGDALEGCEALGIERAHWVGFSFGGRVAAALALEAPERVDRLALLDPALRLPAEFCEVQADEEREPAVFASVEEAVDARLAEGTLFHTPREWLVEELGRHLGSGDGGLRYRYSPLGAIAAWSEMADRPPEVADVPTLFVRGERSWLPQDEHVERYRRRLGDRLRLATLPGGHSLLWDAFEPTGELLAEFLA